MNGDRPWAEWTYMVVGVVAWLAFGLITLAALVSGNTEMAAGMFLCWIALLGLVAMARFLGWVNKRTMR